MARTLKGARYAEGANPALVAFLIEQLPFLAFSEAMEFYAAALPRMAPTEIALLGCNDRFFLLTGLCNRADAIHPWIYDRCREVEAEPDGYLDLWSRFHYKAVDVDEAVPTPQGWRRHGELVPGDFVFGPDGQPTQVVARTPVFTDADCYRVTFCDGYSVVVSGEHLWTVNLTDKSRIDGTNRRRKWKVRTIDTRSLKDEVYRSQSTPTRRYPTVTVAGALAYAAVDLPVHPYVLGVWLGDGTTGRARVTVSRQDVEEMRELIASCGVGVAVTSHSNAASIRIGSGERWKKSSSDVASALRSLGVYYDKRIPAIYQRASIEQRKALLQGLMDTDGSCHNDHGQCIFCSANEVLAADVLELALGLGLKATLKQRSALYQGSPRSYWQVQFLGHRSDPPFRLSRKVERCKEDATQQVRRVVNVTKVESRPVSCIQVARDDGLYVIGRHCVTTHNSSIITFAGSIQEILIDPETCIVIFSNTKDIARPFLIQIKEEFETNEKLKALYPDVLYEHPAKQAPLWSNEGIIVKRKGNPKESTVEAHGLINALPTGKHFPIMVYDDAINERNVTNPEQIRKAKERVELSMPIGIGEKTRRRFVGTRYCTIGETRILMGDFTHKPIRDVQIGEEVVGWEMREGKRYLVRSRVVNAGVHAQQPVVRFGFDNGRTVTCTRDHRWWKGVYGSGPEYRWLHVRTGDRAKDQAARQRLVGKVPDGSKGMTWVQQLLEPTAPVNDRDHGWLAGFFDGEGTIRKNRGHASGSISISQTTHNEDLIEETRAVLTRLGFDWSESWVQQSGKSGNKWSKRCNFHINGGWRERYRFLAAVNPRRREKLLETMFAQMMTERLRVVSEEELIDPADVYWLQTETGNYIAEGLCSSNSYADTYGQMIEEGIAKPRIYPATEDGTLDGKPVFMTQEAWDDAKRSMRSTIAAQMLQNPLAGNENTFKVSWLRPYWVRPIMMTVYIMGDPSRGRSASSDRTALAVVGIDTLGNKYLLDGYCHRMPLSERWRKIKELRKKWVNHPGVQSIKVGYERYGMQSDDEYFAEKMILDRASFDIETLGWTGERGRESKTHRVERLEPDFRTGAFFVPGKVWHDAHKGGARWSINEGSDEIEYRQDPGQHRQERQVRSAGELHRIVEPIRRIDEDGNIYDLTRVFFEEFRFFPFSPRDDFIDAVSRIYDMDPLPARPHEKVVVEDHIDA
jgi:hypothetical protein